MFLNINSLIISSLAILICSQQCILYCMAKLNDNSEIKLNENNDILKEELPVEKKNDINIVKDEINDYNNEINDENVNNIFYPIEQLMMNATKQFSSINSQSIKSMQESSKNMFKESNLRGSDNLFKFNSIPNISSMFGNARSMFDNFKMFDENIFPKSEFDLKQTGTCRYMLTFEEDNISNMDMKIHMDNPYNRYISASYTIENVKKSENGGSSEFRSYQQKTFSIHPSCLVNPAIIRANLAGFVAKLPKIGSKFTGTFLAFAPQKDNVLELEEKGIFPKGLCELLSSGKAFDIQLTKLQHCLLVKGTNVDWCKEQIDKDEQNDLIRVTSNEVQPTTEIFSSTIGKAYRAMQQKIEENKKKQEKLKIGEKIIKVDENVVKQNDKNKNKEICIKTQDKKDINNSSKQENVSNGYSTFMPMRMNLTAQENQIRNALENSEPIITSGPQKLIQLEGRFEEL